MPKFESGQIVQHRRLGYRAVVVSVDDARSGTARRQDPSQVGLSGRRLWYHVLVHDSTNETYVAEGSLEPDDSTAPVDNPLVPLFFDELHEGRYVRNRLLN